MIVGEMWRRLVFFFRRARFDRELAEEMDHHVAMKAEARGRDGLSPEDARHAARRDFGNTLLLRERSHDVWGWAAIETVSQDLRYGLRMLQKSPGFTAVAVLTLALGIGANTAIFSLINAVMFRTLPVPDPPQLVLFTWTTRGAFGTDGSDSLAGCPSGMCEFPYPVFESIHAEQKSFAGTAAFLDTGPMLLSFHGHGGQSQGDFVSSDFFSTLRVRAAIGRTLGAADDSLSAPPAIVLSNRLWEHQFGGDPGVLGKTIYLSRHPFTVVGVATAGFYGLNAGQPADFWAPMAFEPEICPYHWSTSDPKVLAFSILGRLRPGVSTAQAQAATDGMLVHAVAGGSDALVTQSNRAELHLVNIAGGLDSLQKDYLQPLTLLLALAGILILLACANVAGLTLARSTARQREVAVRLALGTTPWRLVRQLLTESLLLAAAGGALGVLFAYWGASSVVTFLSANLRGAAGSSVAPLAVNVHPDLRVLGFAVLASTLVGILAGLAPALRSLRIDLASALKNGSLPGMRSAHGWRRLGGFRSTLVVAQIALSLLVLVGAGLLVRSVVNREMLPLGFDPHHLLTFTLNPTLTGLKSAQIAALYADLQSRLEALPGVVSATYSSVAPMSGPDAESFSTYQVPALPQRLITSHSIFGDLIPMAAILSVGPRFFNTLGVRVVEGRSLNAEDFLQALTPPSSAKRPAGQSSARGPASPGANAEDSLETLTPPSSTERQAGQSSAGGPASPAAIVPVVVNRAFVEQTFGERDPLGYEITNAGPLAAGRIIGVVADFAYDSPRLPLPATSPISFYGAPGDRPTIICILQGGPASFVIRTAPSPEALIPSVRQIVSKVSGSLVLTDVSTVTGGIGRLIYRERLVGWLASLFALLALLLSCIGLYGLLAWEVTQRTREIGIRMALGAQREAVLRAVLLHAAKLAIFGAIGGLALAFALTRLLHHFLFGVSATDPASFAAGVLLLLLTALAGCYYPARRAMKVDPMVALRYE